MKSINRKTRRWSLVIALGLALVLVWWLRVYRPLQSRMDGISTQLEKESLELVQLKRRLKEISGAMEGYEGKDDYLKRFSEVFIGEDTLVELNAAVQARLQEFIENHEIALAAYKELPPEKWREYSVGMLEFQLSTSLQGLSDLLQFLETQKGTTGIDMITISYRSSSNQTLIVSLRVGTLFVNELIEKTKL